MLCLVTLRKLLTDDVLYIVITGTFFIYINFKISTIAYIFQYLLVDVDAIGVQKRSSA